MNAPRRSPSWSRPFAPCEAHGCAHRPDRVPKGSRQSRGVSRARSDLSISAFAKRIASARSFDLDLGDVRLPACSSLDVHSRRSRLSRPPCGDRLGAASDRRRRCLSASTPATVIGSAFLPCGSGFGDHRRVGTLRCVSRPCPVRVFCRLSTIEPSELTSRRPAPFSPCGDHGAVRRRLTVHGLAMGDHVSAGRRATAFRQSRSVTTCPPFGDSASDDDSIRFRVSGRMTMVRLFRGCTFG